MAFSCLGSNAGETTSQFGLSRCARYRRARRAADFVLLDRLCDQPEPAEVAGEITASI